MKRKIKELKRIARSNLTGNYYPMISAYIWIMGLTMLAELPFSMLQTPNTFSTSNMIYYVAQILINIVAIILIGGEYRMHLSLARNGKAEERLLFSLIKEQPDRYITVNFLYFGLTLITLSPAIAGIALVYFYHRSWIYLLAIALGLISILCTLYVSISYSLVFFLMQDNTELYGFQALREAKKLLQGSFKRCLYLQLSFLPLTLVSLLTFGIGMFWLEPYMIQTMTLFYLDTKEELDQVQTARRNMSSPKPTTINEYV